MRRQRLRRRDRQRRDPGLQQRHRRAAFQPHRVERLLRLSRRRSTAPRAIRGPEPTDPSCYYDPQYGRWFHVVLTLEVDPSAGFLTGPNHLDIAVSVTSSPLNGWVFYHLPVQDDGTQGTPKHKGCPCIGDFPHIGADQNGFFITTNEYPLSSGPGKVRQRLQRRADLRDVQVLALAQNSGSVKVVHIAGPDSMGTTPSFTLWPNEVPGTAYDTMQQGDRVVPSVHRDGRGTWHRHVRQHRRLAPDQHRHRSTAQSRLSIFQA